MLAAAGVALVLLASAYAGLTSSDPSDSSADRGVQVTPVTDVDAVEPGPGLATTPAPIVEATPTPNPLNRQDCNTIRGTPYASPEERTWYLANCLR